MVQFRLGSTIATRGTNVPPSISAKLCGTNRSPSPRRPNSSSYPAMVAGNSSSRVNARAQSFIGSSASNVTWGFRYHTTAQLAQRIGSCSTSQMFRINCRWASSCLTPKAFCLSQSLPSQCRVTRDEQRTRYEGTCAKLDAVSPCCKSRGTLRRLICLGTLDRTSHKDWVARPRRYSLLSNGPMSGAEPLKGRPTSVPASIRLLPDTNFM